MKKGMLIGLIALCVLCLIVIIGSIYGLISYFGDSEKLNEQLVRTHSELTPRVLNGPTPMVHYGPTPTVPYESTPRVPYVPSPTSPQSYLSFNYLGSLEYLTTDLQDTEYHCTAIMLTPKQILASRKCGGEKVWQNPMTVSLGSNNNINIDVTNENTKFGNDMMLFDLIRPISTSQFAAKVGVAPQCKNIDLNEETKLFAVGFAQSNDGTHCNIFQQELHLISPDKCQDVPESNTHVCVRPGKSVPSAYQDANCMPCLTASGSVLHVELADGSLCVAGIATPTTTECSINSEAVSFTLIEKIDSSPKVNYGTTPSPTTVHYEPPSSSFHYLGSLEYFTGDLYDSEFRCTSIVLAPNQLLTTTKCVGRLPKENPKAVVLGASDFERSANVKYINIEIKRGTEKFGNDLMILNMNRPISETEFAANVSVANRCVNIDLNKDTKLFAVGFAQSDNMLFCNLFQQELHLISPDKCQDAPESDTHVCLKPGKSYSSAGQNDSCVQCLTASASVLHVQRADGSICVAGLATPTTQDCNKTEEPVSFTIIEKVLPKSLSN